MRHTITKAAQPEVADKLRALRLALTRAVALLNEILERFEEYFPDPRLIAVDEAMTDEDADIREGLADMERLTAKIARIQKQPR